MKLLIITLLFGIVYFINVNSYHCDINGSAEDKIVLSAINDFAFAENEHYVLGYFDKKNDAMALNAAIYKKEFAAGQASFPGVSGNYNVIITTLTEIDGESTYILYVNNREIGTFQNPETDFDYQPYKYQWEEVQINHGDLIVVAFNAHSNGMIPEGDAFAFSRGRWCMLEFYKC